MKKPTTIKIEEDLMKSFKKDMIDLDMDIGDGITILMENRHLIPELVIHKSEKIEPERKAKFIVNKTKENNLEDVNISSIMRKEK